MAGPARRAISGAKTAVFLGWAVNEGLIAASPLAGWRQPRRSRAERVEQPGRALADAELPALWAAFATAADPFLAAYLRILLLTGQRRTETAAMRWGDVDLPAGVWTIPAEITKVGREHRVPLAHEAAAILGELPRLAGSELVFPGRGGRLMSGWTHRLAPVQAASGLARWTLHDLRRTARSGYSALGIDHAIAELNLNHAISDDLVKVYDRHDHWRARADAAARWARHLAGLVVESARQR